MALTTRVILERRCDPFATAFMRTPSTVSSCVCGATSTTSYPERASERHSLWKIRTSKGECTEVRCTTFIFRSAATDINDNPGLLGCGRPPDCTGGHRSSQLQPLLELCSKIASAGRTLNLRLGIDRFSSSG